MKRLRGLMLLVAVLTALALAGLWWQSGQSRERLRLQAAELASQRSLNLADAMGGQIEGVLGSLDAALLGLRRDWLQSGHSASFGRLVQETLSTLPDGFVDYVSVVDAQGHIVFNSYGVAGGVFVGDRPHFQAHRGGGDQLLVGKPVRSRLSGQWVFVVSRPILRAGRFDGTVHLLVSSDYVAARLAGLRLNEQDVVALVHHEGDFLAHSRDNAQVLSTQVPAGHPFMTDRVAGGGVFRYRSELDQHWRTAGWWRHFETGLVTVVALSDEMVMEPLRPALEREQYMTMVLTVMLLVGASLIIVLLGRVDRSQDQLRALAAALEDRVAQRTRELAALNAELEAFAYSVSHDLRTPLRSIHGFAALLEDDDAGSLSETGRGYVRRIQGATGRMGQLITDLLSMAHLNRSAIKLEPLDLGDLARSIADELQRGEASRQVQWEIGADMKVMADPVLMRAVLQNLLGNAWKYTRQTLHPRISLVLESCSDGVQTFRVSDNGAGFDMRYAEQLFQPFRRLHAHHEFEGTGVGLATVKRIIERHGGQVRGEGVVGQGASFWFSLPDRQPTVDETA
ncbi:MAG: sensor histidine kinase [Gammaproteobacteria bacterium]